MKLKPAKWLNRFWFNWLYIKHMFKYIYKCKYIQIYICVYIYIYSMCISMYYLIYSLLLVHSYSNSTVLPVGHFSVFLLSRREAPDLCLTPKLKLQVRVKHKLAIVRKQNVRQERGHIRHARAVVHHNLTTLVPLLLCPIWRQLSLFTEVVRHKSDNNCCRIICRRAVRLHINLNQ